MTPLQWTYLIAAAWAGIIAFVWRSVPSSPAYLRRIILAGGAATVLLILVEGTLISRYFTIVKTLDALLPSANDSRARNQPPPVEVTLEINKDNSVAVDDGAAVPMASLKEELRKHLPADRKAVVTIVSQPDAKYESANEVLDVCKELKIEDVTFTLTSGE